ncbi:unnamed protein product [Cylindrotheca closterium]|uniref:dolichyl-phosphate beta-glucosyltransferase n=1 Tax=Cylindrotheca closterium TaxID=2856 RepID=A0AAD2GB43_9STRA|nr:unnamed protein product [Cylindrotheca closterium]
MESSIVANTIAAIAVVIMVLGLAWVFYPAWLVAMAPETKWTILRNNEDDSNEAKSATTAEHKIVLSLVIPAYNEEERIPIMLQSAHDFLQSTQGIEVLDKLNQVGLKHNHGDQENDKRTISVEWIVVDDGSVDKTCEVVTKVMKSIQSKNYLWKIVSLEKNCGKGAAIKTGMSIAKGHYSLMVDADGATDFGPGLQKLVDNLFSVHNDGGANNRNMIAVFGSRAHLQGESTAKRSLVRSFLMWAFHFFVRILVSSTIQDTQCGFKLFDQQAARLIFGNLHLQRWAFDTEVVCLCHLLQVTMLEVAVPWQEIEGSKLSTSKFALAMASITMLRDMICVRLCYTLRLWTASSSSLQPQSNSKRKSS